MISQLNMIILMQPVLQTATEFYQFLGFELIFEIPEKWVELALSTGLKLGLCPGSAIPVEPLRTGLVFQVTNLLECYERLNERGFVVGKPITKVHGIMMNVIDPGNNSFDLYQPTPQQVRELIKQVKEDSGCKKNGGCRCKPKVNA